VEKPVSSHASEAMIIGPRYPLIAKGLRKPASLDYALPHA